MDATDLLRAWSERDEAARDELVPLVERELHRLARAYMRRERQGHTLQATALVNEVFLRLAHGSNPRWQDRAHFVGIAAHLMRQVLVDHARARGYRKRGGGVQRVPLDNALLITPDPSSTCSRWIARSRPSQRSILVRARSSSCDSLAA
jgi:RNA polymerase sigma factor (TIGR02999 family)